MGLFLVPDLTPVNLWLSFACHWVSFSASSQSKNTTLIGTQYIYFVLNVLFVTLILVINLWSTDLIYDENGGADKT